MSLPPIDILKAALVCAATIAAVLLLVHRSRQTKVDRSVQSSGKIAMRILLLHAMFVIVLCGQLKIPMNTLLLIVPFVWLLTYTAPWNIATSPTDFVGFAFLLTLMAPFYLMQQFVLGFPDLHLVVLEPPSVPLNREPPLLPADAGVVVSTLRPMGHIELAGERFSAAAADGKMLDIGTPIRVCGSRGNVILVVKRDDPVA